MRYLYILRHAKSDWDSNAKSDFDRPLNTRGRQDAPKIGEWMSKTSIRPDVVLCSTAIRARQTIEAVTKNWHPMVDIHYDERLYLAGLDTLLNILAEVPEEHCHVMLVGHNPGLDQLVWYLSRTEPTLTKSGKLMTTASLAVFELPTDWSELEKKGQLADLVRPRDL